MRQNEYPNTLEARSQQLLDGPLKHVRAAALAAVLLPLASVAAAPAQAQDCGLLASGGTVCGTVFYDANPNGVQDAGDTPIVNAVVTVEFMGVDYVTYTDADGAYVFVLPPGDYVVEVQIPPLLQPVTAEQGGDDSLDSDGTADGLGNSTAPVSFNADEETYDSNTDFGFTDAEVVGPGTGTPGYWKNHPEAWPLDPVVIGGVPYSKAVAITWLNDVGKDKTTTIFASLVSAKLNVAAGNDDSCIASTITAADAWMATYGPVGSNVKASSFAWKVGEPLHRLMDNYNNGMLCVPHRD